MTLTGKRCQCGGCGRVFSRLSTFDKHRTGEFGSASNPRRCRTDAELAAVNLHEKGGVWVTTGGYWDKRVIDGVRGKAATA